MKRSTVIGIGMLLFISSLVLTGCGCCSWFKPTPTPRPTATPRPTPIPPTPTKESLGAVSGGVFDADTGQGLDEVWVAVHGTSLGDTTDTSGLYVIHNVPLGAHDVVVDSDDHVFNAKEVSLDMAGTRAVDDIFLTQLAPPERIDDDDGGYIVAPDGRTTVYVPPGALPRPTDISITPIRRVEDLPAPPPPGRPVLAMLDLRPDGMTFSKPVEIAFDLPPRPKYREGDELDILQFNKAALTWDYPPAGIATVNPDEVTATGELSHFSIFILVGPEELGTGDVQITLRWYNTADLDLIVVDPDGEEVSIDYPVSSSGGQLDVDANWFCETITSTPVENIFWPTGKAPLGEYTIYVRYWLECAGEGPTDFEIRVLVDGEEAFASGTIAPEDEIIEVGTFTR